MSSQLASAILQSVETEGSGEYARYVAGEYGPPGLMFNVTAYQHKWHQDYIGDAYDGHGYKGSAPGYINWTGGYEYVYTWTGGS